MCVFKDTIYNLSCGDSGFEINSANAIILYIFIDFPFLCNSSSDFGTFPPSNSVVNDQSIKVTIPVITAAKLNFPVVTATKL